MNRFVDDSPIFGEVSGPPRSLAILLNRLGIEFESEAVRREKVADWLRRNDPVPRLERELRKQHLLG